MYPALGSTTAYVRQSPQGEILQGTATIHAIVMDGNRRVMAHLKDPNIETAFNVDLSCLNPSEQFVDQFTALTATVKSVGDEGNAKAQEVIKDYNKRIDELYSSVLGKPVEIVP